ALVQISRVARLRRHVLGEIVFAHGIEYGWIAVYPDRVVIIPDRVHVGAGRPGASDSLLIVENVAQTEHTAGVAAGAQALQRCGECDRTPPYLASTWRLGVPGLRGSVAGRREAVPATAAATTSGAASGSGSRRPGSRSGPARAASLA